MSFKSESARILSNHKNRQQKLNALDLAHRRYRDIEVKRKLQEKPKNNSKFARLIWGRRNGN